MIRPLARTLHLTALLALAVGCGRAPEAPAAPAAPQDVILVTDLPAEDLAAAKAALEGGQPPLKLTIVAGGAPTPGADVFWSAAPGPAVALAKAGKTLAHVPAKPPAVRDAAGSWNGAAGVGWVLLLNRTLLPPGAMPDSVEDLTNPRFRGFLSLVPPAHPLLRDYRAALTEVWGAEQARILVDLMGRNDARTFPTMAVTAGMVAAGRVMFTMVDTVTAKRFMDVNAQLEMIVPDQDALGVLLVPSVVVIPADAPHAEAARALVDRIVATPMPGRLVPRPELKVMAADVTRFTAPAAESPLGPEGLPVAPEGAEDDPALAAEAPATAPPTAAPSAAGKPRKAKP
jgi:ABC-type Fe3+ transport system substrate-binding protein